MLAGRVIKLLDEGLIRGRDRQERVRLEGERGVEQAHSGNSVVIPAAVEAASRDPTIPVSSGLMNGSRITAFGGFRDDSVLDLLDIPERNDFGDGQHALQVLAIGDWRSPLAEPDMWHEVPV